MQAVGCMPIDSLWWLASWLADMRCCSSYSRESCKTCTCCRVITTKGLPSPPCFCSFSFTSMSAILSVHVCTYLYMSVLVLSQAIARVTFAYWPTLHGAEFCAQTWMQMPSTCWICTSVHVRQVGIHVSTMNITFSDAHVVEFRQHLKTQSLISAHAQWYKCTSTWSGKLWTVLYRASLQQTHDQQAVVKSGQVVIQ